jgi:T-complex protein 1 subunit theta
MLGFARPGASGLLKEGGQHYYGVQEAVLKNIEACKLLASIVRSSFGPNGNNKLICNRLDKLFITSDAATIVRELEVVHPAAKMVVAASQAQEREFGDGTGLVIVLAGELLNQAGDLLHQGLHPSEIVKGYKRSCAEALRILQLPDLELGRVGDLRDVETVADALRACLASKHWGAEAFLSKLVAKACIEVLPTYFDGSTVNDLPLVEYEDDDATRDRLRRFNIDNVRVVKVLGGSLFDSTILRGTILVRDTEGTVKHVANAKVALFTNDIDMSPMETKGTVLLHSGKELESYTKNEEHLLGERIRKLSEAGVNVVVTGGKFGEVALHYLEMYGMMAVRCPSKYDLRRVVRATGAVAVSSLTDTPPTKDELGICDKVTIEEQGSTKMIVFRQDSDATRITTILLRGATQNLLDDIERAIDDAVHAFKTLACRDPRLVPGAGATEAELASRLDDFADRAEGLEQYAMKRFVEALKIVPRTLAENAGQNTTDVITRLCAAHRQGNLYAGIDVGMDDSDQSGPSSLAGILDSKAYGIADLLATKYAAIKQAVDVACTILMVDALIMSKQVSGTGGT